MRAIRPKLRSHPREHIVTIDTDSAPRVMFYGENLLLEDLPVGTRVIYPKRPMTPVANPRAAIRYALNHPDDSRRAGVRQVLISGALDFTMRPLARYLGVDDLIANQLEFVENYATGKLKKPFVAGATKADIMRAYARQHAIDLAESWAYTDSFSDYPMLAVVGHPTACNPDLRLRSLARSYDWPVLDLDEEPDRSVARRPQGLAPVRRIRGRPTQPE